MKQLVEFSVNGEIYEVAIEPHRTLLEVLRENIGFVGTKKGCDEGTCGACTVLLDGKPVLSCIMLATDAVGKSVETIEGQAVRGRPTPLQKAFIDYGAIQCGFCSPGLIFIAKALPENNPRPTDQDIKEAISGNLCRCTGYIKIVEAIRVASQANVQQE